MHLQPEYLSEYLAEVNAILRPPDQERLLCEFLHPLKMYLTKRTRVISFALARYCGASARLALTSEWLYQTSQLNYDKSALLEENTLYFQDRYAAAVDKNPSLKIVIEQDIKSRFLPLQLKYLRDTTRDLIQAQVGTAPWLRPWLAGEISTRPLTTKFRLQAAFYTREISPELFASELRYGEGFALLVLPCLVGILAATKHRPELFADPVDFQTLETVLFGISTLYELATHFTAAHYYYVSQLSSSALTGWYVASPEYRRQKVRADWNTQKFLESLRGDYRQRTTRSLESLSLPARHRGLLEELLAWSYAPDG